MTVAEGETGNWRQGEEDGFVGPGKTVLFETGEANKFWAEGGETQKCSGTIKVEDGRAPVV